MIVVAETPQTWVDFITQVGYVGIAVAFAWALFTDRLISGSRYCKDLEEEQKREQEWKALAEGAIARIERAVEIAKRT